jgi:hypothetical protein
MDGGLFDHWSKGSGVDQVADDGERAAVGVFVRMIVDVARFVLVLSFGVVLVGVGLLVVR